MFKFCGKFLATLKNGIAKTKLLRETNEVGNTVLKTVNRKTNEVVKVVEKTPTREGLVWFGNSYLKGTQHVTTVSKNGTVVQKNIVTDLPYYDGTTRRIVQSVKNPGKSDYVATKVDARPDSVAVNKSLPNNFNYRYEYRRENGKLIPEWIPTRPNSNVNVLTHGRLNV